MRRQHLTGENNGHGFFLRSLTPLPPLLTPVSLSLPARLAVESCVHEARGLDVLPSTIAKFRNNGDEPTAALLESIVYPEEVNHCRAGVRWFR